MALICKVNHFVSAMAIVATLAPNATTEDGGGVSGKLCKVWKVCKVKNKGNKCNDDQDSG